MKIFEKLMKKATGCSVVVYLSFGHVHFVVLERFTAASSQQISDGRATLCCTASLSFDSQERCGRIDLQRSSSMRRDLEHLRFVERFDSCTLTRQKNLSILAYFQPFQKLTRSLHFMACHGCGPRRHAQVRPTQEEQCDQILPCPAWRVKAAKFLAVRLGLLGCDWNFGSIFHRFCVDNILFNIIDRTVQQPKNLRCINLIHVLDGEIHGTEIVILEFSVFFYIHQILADALGVTLDFGHQRFTSDMALSTHQFWWFIINFPLKVAVNGCSDSVIFSIMIHYLSQEIHSSCKSQKTPLHFWTPEWRFSMGTIMIDHWILGFSHNFWWTRLFHIRLLTCILLIPVIYKYNTHISIRSQ